MKMLRLEKRSEWRAWLEANAERVTEVWLMYHKKHSGRPSLTYLDAVEEAICFGWIDGKIKRLDEKRFAQRFTPRNPKSRWARSNIERARRMIREGKMTPAGLRVFNPGNPILPLPAELPAALEKQFFNHKTAWENFHRFPPSYRRMTIGWVASAKKPETQLRRLSQLIAQSAANKRIKFM